jgi:hypothetical protein
MRYLGTAAGTPRFRTFQICPKDLLAVLRQDRCAETDRWRLRRYGRVRSLTDLPSAGVAMAITSYLDDFDVDPETKRVLDVALEMTRTALGLADNLANGIIAKRIIELARAGERHPDLLCEGALKTLRGHLFGD